MHFLDLNKIPESPAQSLLYLETLFRFGKCKSLTWLLQEGCNYNKSVLPLPLSPIKYKCDVVIIRGGTKSNLEMHVELKHLEITYKCDEECNFQGGYEFNLRMHIKNWYR